MNYTKVIKDISIKIYKTLGAGYHETIYQRAVLAELKSLSIPHEFERVIPIMYNKEYVGSNRADVVIDNKYVVELKAMTREPKFPEKYQLLSYLQCLNLKQGIVINFPQPSVSSDKLVRQNVPNFLEVDLDNREEVNEDSGEITVEDV